MDVVFSGWFDIWYVSLCMVVVYFINGVGVCGFCYVYL